jgi:DNA-binding response OmpR family regulator
LWSHHRSAHLDANVWDNQLTRSFVSKTRRAALAAAGYAVEPATSLTGAIAKILEGDFDLILLCTLREEERLRLLHICRRRIPSTPILVVSENGAASSASGTAVIPQLQLVAEAVAGHCRSR